MRSIVAAVVVVAMFALAPASAMADATGAAQKDPVKLRLKGSPYGKVLFANGFAAYVFTADGDSGSACDGECVSEWPPLRAGEVVAGNGVRRGLIGETVRDDGSKQLTYAGSPIYLWYGDPRGEVFCHDVFEFGGDWFAVKRSGRPALH